MVIRELFALVGIQTDMASVQKADNAMAGLKQVAQSLGELFFTGTVALGLSKLVKLASDVEETANVLNVAFEEQADGVRDWASSTASEVGRSEFMLQSFAAQVGAMTRPLLGSGKAAAGLSTDMAKLAVDLSSFFITTENDALIALKSGLVGETEPMRRFGVVMTQAALDAFALEKGMGKTVDQMSESEKLQIRYAFMMSRTSQAQGDAARTADGYANSTRALESRLKDLGIRIGQALLPGATRLVRIALAGVNAFLELAKGTKIFEVALAGLSAVMTFFAIKAILPFAPMIAGVLAVAAVVAGLALVIEDVWAFFDGRVSVTGKVLDKLKARFPALVGIFENLKLAASRLWDAITAKAAQFGLDLRSGTGGAVDWLSRQFQKFLDWVEPRFRTFLDWLAPRIQALTEINWGEKIDHFATVFGAFVDKAIAFFGTPAGKALLTAGAAWLGAKVGGAILKPVGDMLSDSANPEEAGGLGTWLAGKAFSVGGPLLGGLAGMAALNSVSGGATNVREVDAAATARSFGLPPSTGSLPAGAGGSASREVTVNSTVTVNGTASPEQKEEVRQIFREEHDRAARELRAGLVPSFGKI